MNWHFAPCMTQAKDFYALCAIAAARALDAGLAALSVHVTPSSRNDPVASTSCVCKLLICKG
jgi:hypothetical protein